jgi:branched-chain amino acid transport system permease protein
MAIRDNEIAAQSLGINVLRSRLLAFCVSAFFTAVAGSLWAHFIMSFSPRSFYFAETFSVITMLVLGGMGSLSGSIVGAVSITALSEILRNAERGVSLGFIHLPPIYGASQILMAIIFILVIIFWPKGLLGNREIGFTGLWSRLLPGTARKSIRKEVE